MDNASMWNRLSIRWQLLVLLAVILSIIEGASLFTAYWFDAKERKLLALEQVETLGRALNHDLVRALVNPQADVYADISFRLNGFESVAALYLTDANGIETYRHLRDNVEIPSDFTTRANTKPYFTDKFLYVRQPLSIDGYQYGTVSNLIDLSRYKTKLREHLITLLLIFPAELIIGLLIAGWISRSYTRPFEELAQAMGAADVQNNVFPRVKTTANNEVGALYGGYNRMIDQIVNVTSALKYQSEHDSLTNLKNRYAVEKSISDCLQQRIEGTVHTLLFLDIDQFKLINDAAGHVTGDELLRQLAQVIKTEVERAGIIARVGGDDFFILFPGEGEEHGVKQANRLLAALQEFRFTWKREIFTISASIGCVSFRPFEYTLQSLLTAADTAFYSAKAKGRNQLHVYRSDDSNIQQYNADIHAAGLIRSALRSDVVRFELFAQAIVPLQKESSQISYEILLRLRDEQQALVPPNLFLPAADRYDLMVDIDIHVLRTYLETVRAHPDHIAKLAFVNVNLGGSTLNNARFQDALRDAIKHFDFPWNKLVLEVTETSAVGNLIKAADFIKECRAKGIRVALDDFGTGMASFEYLKHLPLDVVKIDGCFIRDMLTDPIDHAMVSYAHKISKLRGQDTIAEFVELAAHVDALKIIGIDYAQGYHLGKPKPLQEWLL